MTPPNTGPVSQDAMVERMYEAMFIGDGQVGGRPGMVEAMNKVVADVAELKAQSNKAAERAWAVGLGAVAGFIGSWFKPAG